jgi:hypothetical protein
MRRIILYTASCLLLFSCTGNETGKRKDVNPEAVFLDYFISGEEGDPNVKVLLQYRFGGPNGATLLLDDPAQVELDGQLIKADSSKLTGAYYEVLKPMNEFAGKHTITFTDANNKKYEEEFIFKPFKLKAGIPAVVKRGELIFELDGLNPVDYIRVFATDTSFATPTINRVDTVKNGRILITVTELEDLVNGPINLEFYKEDERPVKNAPKRGGRIAITYGVKEGFELKD